MPEYRLLVEHVINKVRQPVGHELSVPEQLGKWWVEQGIAELISAPAAPVMPIPYAARAPVFVETRYPPCCGGFRRTK